MKIICAWCDVLITYKCPQCGDPLEPPREPELCGLYRVCRGIQPNTHNPRNVATETYYSIERMETAHGICEKCAEQLEAERTRTSTKNAAKLTERADASELTVPEYNAMTEEDRANAVAEDTADEPTSPPKLAERRRKGGES